MVGWERRYGDIKILVVDDEPGIRKPVSARLRNAGFNVVEASSGEEALAQISDDVALLVTDIVMPGMSGCELARQIRQCRPHLPILFMSAYNPYPVEHLLGCRCLQKPFELSNALLDGVKDAIRRAPALIEKRPEGPEPSMSLEELLHAVKKSHAEWTAAMDAQNEITAEVPTRIPIH